MRVGGWALADLLRRIGVTGSDLVRGTQVHDGISPVLVVGDLSQLGTTPQARQYGEFGVTGAVAGAFSLMALINSLPMAVQLRASAQATNLHLLPGSTPNAAWVNPVFVTQSYRPPNDPMPNPQLQRFYGSQVGAMNFPIESVPINGLSMRWRISPGQIFVAVGTVLNTALFFSVQVDEFVSMEQEI